MQSRRPAHPVRFLSALLGLLALIGAGLWAAMAPARAGDVFTVHGVVVDVTAENARDARVKALDQGRALAFRTLLERLTPQAMHASLPRPTLETLVESELAVEVDREKASSVRYIAEVTYAFRPTEVREFLRLNALSYSENQARPVLVVPVLVLRGTGPQGEPMEQALLWEPENDWAAVWRDPRFSSSLLPVETPFGDTEDLLALDAEKALNAQWADFAPLAARYRADEVLLAVATVSREAQGRTEQVDLTLARLSEDGLETAQGTAQGAAAVPEPGQTRIPTIARPLALEAIDIAMAPWIERWKEKTLVSLGEQQRLSATAVFRSGLADWRAIETALAEIATIIDHRVLALSATGAEIELTFAGSVDQLALLLAQRTVSLSALNNLWVLEAGAVASGVAPSELDPASRPPVEQIYLTPATAPPAAYRPGAPDPYAGEPGPAAEVDDWNRARSAIDPGASQMAPVGQ
ncbi:MAG: DUF2066 domain-containing protein [Alphaproteobacteria bacterium]|nr:DUF2066 domain-containing protein [Alphaproteobacteria bacterium]